MKNATLGLTVPLLLLIAAASATLAPPAAAQGTLYEISGRVVSDTGAPIAGVQVNGYTYHEDSTRSSVGSSDSAMTDDDGRFTLELAEGRGSINVYYEKWRRSDHREITVSGNVSDLQFTLITPPPRTAIITGTVVGPDGRPIEGAEVQLSYGCCYAYPAVEDAAATPPSDGEGSSGSDGNATTTIEPSEPKASPMMTRPAIMPPYHDDHQNTRTDSEGRFRFEAYGGPRQISVYAKGFAQTTQDVDAKDNDTVDVTVRLEKVPERNAILTGRVVNADTNAPVKGAVVALRSLEWGRYAEYRTGDDGRFRIQTVPGWTEVAVHFYPSYAEPIPLVEGDTAVSSDLSIARPALESQFFPLSVVLDLDPGDNERDLELAPKPKPSVALVGYVVDPDAKTGVEGARVSVWNHQTGDWGEAITDKTGSFKILVSPGHYSANAWKEGHLSGTQSFLLEDKATQRIDLVLPKGVARYSPCYDNDDGCGPMIMYAEGKAVASSGASDVDGATTTGSAPPAAPGAEPAARSESMLTAQDEATSGAPTSGPDTSRTATFSGSGGGLPPYDPEGAPAVAASENEQKAASEVPGLGIVALLAVAALGALAMRRR